METLPTKLPHEYLAIPIQIFEPRINFDGYFVTYTHHFYSLHDVEVNGKENIAIPLFPKPLSRQSERDRFREQILNLDPDSITF